MHLIISGWTILVTDSRCAAPGSLITLNESETNIKSHLQYIKSFFKLIILYRNGNILRVKQYQPVIRAQEFLKNIQSSFKNIFCDKCVYDCLACLHFISRVQNLKQVLTARQASLSWTMTCCHWVMLKMLKLSRDVSAAVKRLQH